MRKTYILLDELPEAGADELTRILRIEGNGDVFTVRRWEERNDGGDSSDEDMDEGSDSDTEMLLPIS